MNALTAFFPNPFASKPAAPAKAPAAPAANAAAKPAADSLALSARPAAAPAKPAPKPVEIVQPIGTSGAVMGVGSAAVGVGLAAWGLVSVFPALALPILGGAAAVGGLLAIAGVGIAKNWGDKNPFVHGLMTRFAGYTGMASVMVGGGIAMGLTAMSLPGVAGAVCWPALVLAELAMAGLAYGMIKAPVQTPGLPVQR